MKPFTLEHKQRISEALKNRFTGKASGISRKDGGYIYCKVCYKERYINIKKLKKVKYCSQACYMDDIKKNGHPLKGYKHSAKAIESYRKKNFSKQHRENLSKSAMGKKVSDTTREKIRQNTIQQHIKGFPQTNTSIEKIIETKLKEANIQYEHPYPFGRFVCDFAIVDRKIIIECDGIYWHNREDMKKRDKAKDAYIEKSGWKILRFWETDIKSQPNKCLQIIKEKICQS